MRRILALALVAATAVSLVSCKSQSQIQRIERPAPILNAEVRTASFDVPSSSTPVSVTSKSWKLWSQRKGMGIFSPQTAGFPIQSAAQGEGNIPKIRLACATKGSNYYHFGQLLKSRAKEIGIDIELVETPGSNENFRKMADNNAKMAITQADALDFLAESSPEDNISTEQVSLFSEPIFLIANSGSGINSVADMDPAKHKVYVGSVDSGSALTWGYISTSLPRYRKFKTSNLAPRLALLKVAQEKNSVLIFVGGINSKFMDRAEKIARKRRIKLARFDDWSLLGKKDRNGNEIYVKTFVPVTSYPNLLKASAKTAFSIETLGVLTILAMKTSLAEGLGEKKMDEFSSIIKESKEVNEARMYLNSIK